MWQYLNVFWNSTNKQGQIQYWLAKSLYQLLWKRPNSLKTLNKMQEFFCLWNAEQLDISLDESRKRYLQSWQAISNGHSGYEFKFFSELSYDIFKVFFDDTPKETFEAYLFHSHLHFLKMLTFPEPTLTVEQPIIHELRKHKKVVVLDFGCGLAQYSWWLAEQLMAYGCEIELVLVDIATIRKPFLLWLGDKLKIPLTFLESTAQNPIPDLPPCHICVVTEVFEHLHEPIPYFLKMDSALLPQGFLRTNIADHSPGYMHVSANLSPLRHKIAELGYLEANPYTIYRKGQASLSQTISA